MGSRGKLYSALLGGVAATALLAGAAYAEDMALNIASQPLGDALNEFAVQSKHSVVFAPGLVAQKTSRGVSSAATAELALAELLDGSGLSYRKNGDTFLIVSASDPQSGSAAGDGADGTVQALIVTAQKREENIQDVPIAMSAFTQEALERSQIAGGPDLITQVPNMTFTKTNFSSYSIQLRGIGTQAISATTDPAVAVAFNNTPFVRNRFFEQEFYDLQRVEVLRGPQGTLYGRNATAGVVNIISQKPKFTYEAKLSADLANYSSSRLEGMVNVPLVDDVVALRLAGAWTKRDGFVTNQITGNPIDGRDLWSTRLSLRFAPNEHIDANLIWEHFEENDDRLRSGKQLCHTHEVTEVAGIPTPNHYQTFPGAQQPLFAGIQGTFSQGCAPASLYDPGSFETPNGISLPYYVPLSAVFLPTALTDPYVSRTQSHELRVIESTVDPKYKAKNDTVEFQIRYDLSDTLSLTSETAWASDFVFSTQDFNRFNTASGAWDKVGFDNTFPAQHREGVLTDGPNGAIFCDPQIGCADRLVAVDLSTARSRHFSQEFRLASDFEGPFNFSLGGNFLRYDTEDKYYVFINSLSLIAAISPSSHPSGPLPPYQAGVTSNSECLVNGPTPPDSTKYQQILVCTYMDPNPIGSLNDLGHNYFLSRNPYKLISYAVFGEAYYKLTDNLKITAGLRWTVDKKEAPRIPSWLLAGFSAGYPVLEVIDQEWREPTGRLTVDWKPDLSFTDETLVYASLSHGYKAGGANPPPYGIALYLTGAVSDAIITESATHPKTFDPEFVNAFELGSKNTLLDGRMTLNVAGFYYDYKDYQISQIVDRSATNLNFDAKVWGLELEADWRAMENLRFGLKLGYEKTRVGDGEKAIDLMDRTAGQRGWVVVRPFPSIPSNCVVPEWLFLGNEGGGANPELTAIGYVGGGNPGACELSYILHVDPIADPQADHQYDRQNVNYAAYSTDRADYPCLPAGADPATMTAYPGVDPQCLSALSNNGQGFYKDLGGNELPNAPHFTTTITADYTIPLPHDWLATLHTDLYYQSEAWTRIFNMAGYDKLKAYTNVNIAAIFTNEDAGWKVMAYVKNVLDRDSITGAFLNSDDTGLTTNVFLTEPRLYGLRITKDWNGGPWWTGADPNHTGPYPLTIEIGGQVQRHDAPYSSLLPSFNNQFSDTLDIAGGVQHRDLDWGDGREVRLTWRPTGGVWNVAFGARSGETNNGTREVASEPGDCAAKYVGPNSFAAGRLCEPSWSEVFARNREEYQLVDFAVGRDVGFGGLRRSAVSAGIQYGKFQSTSAVKVSGVPDANLPKYGLLTGVTHHRYDSSLVGQREFKGAGPVLAWEASWPIAGNDSAGHLDLNWAVGGGVLFGKQTTSILGDETAKTYNGAFQDAVYWTTPDQVVTTPVAHRRSNSTTAPLANLALGLAYEVGRINVGAGYRWERYFNALDVGYAGHKDGDRTIDGPYFKIAVGFGG